MNLTMAIAQRFAFEVWQVLAEMSPYLLLGFLVAGVLHVLIPASLVQKHLGRGGLWPIVKSALIGVPLPLCSCGVIPVAAAMRREGASRGATVSFLLSTPQTGVDSILVTYSLLGPLLAVYRAVVAFLTGLIGGVAIEAAEHNGDTAPQAVSLNQCSCCDESCEVCEMAHQVLYQSTAAGSCCEDSSCSCSEPVQARGQADPCGCQDGCDTAPAPRSGNNVARMLHYGFVTLPRDIGKPLLIGMVIAGVITAAIPHDFFAPYLGNGLAAMLVMMAIGIPMYVCSTSSVPIAAALISAGVSPGAAFVFLVTGPVTNAAEIATIWRMLGKRTVAVYLATVVACSLGFGFALDWIIATTGWQVSPVVTSQTAEEVNIAFSLVLLCVMLYAFWPRGRRSAAKPVEEDPMATEKKELLVSGMSCGGCVNAVTKALKMQPGVDVVEVDLQSGHATVSGTELNVEDLVAAVERLGYKAMLLQTV